jgi:hypothetical protein
MTVPSDGSVTTAKLGDSSVTTAKINDGSVTSAKLSGLGNYVIEKIDSYNVGTQVSTTTGNQIYFDIANGNTLNFTPTSTNDIILFSGFSLVNHQNVEGVGLGVMRATSSSIGSGDTIVARQGSHANYYNGASAYSMANILAYETNLTAGTTYYYEMFGLTHGGSSGVRYFNREVANSLPSGRDRFTAIHYKYIG